MDTELQRRKDPVEILLPLRRWLGTLRALQAFGKLIRRPSPHSAIAMESALRLIATPAELRHTLEILRGSKEIERLLHERYMPSYSLRHLGALPVGTLGRQFYEHMARYKLTSLQSQFFPRERPRDDVSYLRLRNYQTHDIWHVLTGYPADILGEISILGFYLAQFEQLGGSAAELLMIPSALIAIGVLLHSIAFAPRLFVSFLRGFSEGWQRGSQARPLIAEKWEERWHCPVASLRREFAIPPRLAA